jgi:Domain of unknown function (DUF4124)
MRKIVLTTFLVFGLFAMTENIFGQGFYKWVDEKGTIHFSDNPTSSVFDKEKEPPKENGIEVLKRLEMGNRPPGVALGAKSIRIGYSSGSGSGGSIKGGSTTIRTGRA